jgi:hypothetical protein
MPRFRSLSALLVTFALLALPASAMALAGGSTGGGGGGGGGGGFSGGGGGFSGGGGGSCTGDNCGGGGWIALIVIGGVILFMGASALGAAVQKARMERKLGKIEDAAKAANADDGYWDPAMLKQRVRECFFPIQNSWENRSVVESRPFCSDGLYERHTLQLDGLEKQNRVNRIQDLDLQSIELVRIHNVTDDGEDRFVARIKCSARDWMEDTETGALINGSKQVSQFEQFWSFARHPQHGWVLDEIQQGTEGEYHIGKIVNDDRGEPTYGEQPAATS